MNKLHQLNTAIASRSIKIAMLALGIAVGAAGSAAALPNPPITACGQTISTSGYYQVKGNLTASGTCITVAASNVTIDILNTASSDPCNNTTISGSKLSGSAGIHIEPKVKNTFIQGENSVITNFDYGIEDEGTNSSGDDINLSNNLTAGIALLGTGGSFSNFFSGALQHSSGGNCSLPPPQEFGVYLDGGSGSQIFNGITAGNDYGVFESGSTGSTVALMLSGSNIADGYQFNGGSKNYIYDDLAGTDSFIPLSGNDGFGINIISDTNDLITDNTAGGNTDYDINAAGDSTCTSNTYWFNFADMPSTPCINSK
ncbi:MAG TPA: hypothetical protein VMA09_10595 [Candidatus Binataceae bacterium]|nr:hypothetical protein [Candidatus Binataceae bacterium]